LRKRGLILLIAAATLLTVPATTALAQEDDEPEFVPTYGLGDQMMTINLGLFIPLFFSGGDDGVTSTNLSLGGTGNLQWMTHLTNNVAVGGELGGMFAFSPTRTLFMVPITARVEYFFRNYPWEFPVHLGAGMNISRIPNEATKIDPILKPGISMYYNTEGDWAFGANLVYWWVPQYYGDTDFEDPDLTDENRFGNFLELSFSARYRF